MQTDITSYDIDQDDTKILSKSYIVEGRMGKGGADAYTPVEFADTRASSQVVRLLIAVSEGVCEDLTEVYFNYVHFSNYNCTVEWRDGTPNQSVIAGFEDARSPSATFSPFSNMSTTGLYLASVDWHAHSTIVTLTTALMRDVWDSGDVVLSNAVHEIYIRANPSATWTLYYVSDIWAKVSSAWSWDIRVPAPVGVTNGTNWEIKIVRTSPDDPSTKTESKVSWTGLTEVIELTLNYPNTALVGITLWDAAQFGGQIPDILFRITGIKVRIPDNYEPVARTYTFTWGGTFTDIVYYTNNPAYVLLDCLMSTKCLGIAEEDIDLPSFYLLGTICDEWVSDGFGGSESRYTINNQFSVRENVSTFLNYILSVCNANFTTNEFGQLSVFFDRANQPITKQVTNANVLNGIFKYSSNDIEQRTGLVNVTYSNVANYGKTDTVTWVDQGVIDRYGFQTLDIALVGCTSQAAAIRKARWATYQNAYLTDIINFSTLHYGMQFTIGELVRVVDNYNSNNAIAGVITNVQVEGLNTRLYFDREVSGITQVSVLIADTVTLLPIYDSVGSVYSSVVIAGVQDVILNSPFIAIQDTIPNVWKIIGIEKSDEAYNIMGVIHEYATVVTVYSITTDTMSVVESSSLLVTITANVPDYTILYWTVLDITTSGSLDLSEVLGQVTIINGTATFNLTALVDSIVELAETFQLEVRTESITGVVVATSGIVSIEKNPTPTFLYHLTSLPLIDSIIPSTSLATFPTNTAVAYPSIATGVFGNGLMMNFNNPSNDYDAFIIKTEVPNNSNPDFTLRWRFKHPIHEGYENYFQIIGLGDGLSRTPSIPVYRFYSVNTETLVHNNVWVAFSYEKKGSVSYLYIDGVLAATTTVPLPTGLNLEFNFGVPISGNTPYYYDEIMFLAGTALADGANSYVVETTPYLP
jgi:hypothetical protein